MKYPRATMPLRYLRAQPWPPRSNHLPAGNASVATSMVTTALMTPASPGVRLNSTTIEGSTK